MNSVQDLVSIVVPVYKVEEYLSKCIESLLGQTYEHIEIILVDDGSPDSCPEICEYYCKKDGRIKVIHQDNGGLAAARNVGLAHAKGEYVAFVDSDDYVGAHYIESLYNAIECCGADISICNYIKVYDDDCANEVINRKYLILDNITCLKDMYHPTRHGMEFVAWGKLYNIRLFDQYHICYPKGKIHEDMYVTYKLIYNAKKIVYTEEVLYFYRQRENSIMSTSFDLRNLDLIEALREACIYFENRNESDLFSMAINDYFQNCIRIYAKLQRYQKKLKTKFPDQETLIKQYRIDIKKNLLRVNLPIEKKMFYTLFGCFPSQQWEKMLCYLKKSYKNKKKSCL